MDHRVRAVHRLGPRAVLGRTPVHVLGRAGERAARRFRAAGEDHRRVATLAQALGMQRHGDEQVRREAPRVVPGLDDLVDLPEHPRPVTGGERVDRRVEQLGVGEAE